MSSLMSRFSHGCVGAVLALAIGATAAEAKCTRLAFSVNDYGKDGPARDAKAMLDKYIAKWAAERGIKKYTTGKKSVSCELFIDVIVFDEYTCKAAATVCWSGGGTGPAKKNSAARQSGPSGAPVTLAPVPVEGKPS
jgi:hypothetical protein